MRKLTKEDIKLFGDVQPLQKTEDNLNMYRLSFNEEYLGDNLSMDPMFYHSFMWIGGDSLDHALDSFKNGAIAGEGGEARVGIFSIDLAIEGEESHNVASLTGEKLEKFLKGKTNLKLMTEEEEDELINNYLEQIKKEGV